MGFDFAGVFYNVAEDGKEYYNVKIDDTLLELFPQLKNIKFTMKETPLETRKENSPIFKLSMYKPKDKKEDKKE